jgi:hypothetical protein
MERSVVEMVQAYQGYFQADGRFISDSFSGQIPTGKMAIVNILDVDLIENKTRSQQQLEAFDKFVTGIRSINDEPLTDDDFIALESNRVNFTRELDL